MLEPDIQRILEEIDRISESTNFNGIQLLDGTLGAREGAFTTARVGAVAGIDVNISSLLPAATTAAANAASDKATAAVKTWHMSKPSKEEVKPGFTIDFEDLEIKGFSSKAAAAANQKIDLDFGGLGKITLTVASKGTGVFNNGTIAKATSAIKTAGAAYQVGYNQIDRDNNGTISGDEVAQVVADIVGAVLKAAGTNPADVVQLAGASAGGGAATGAFFTVQADGEKLVFTYAGDVGNKDAATAKDPVTATMKALTGNMKVTTTNGTQTGQAHHAVVDVKEPIVGDPGYRAGIGMQIDNTIVADGMRLVIEDTTFVFRTNADSIVGADAAAGEVLIDVSAYTAAADQVNAAIKAMSNYTTANFKITALTGGTANGAIWIDQTEESLAANNFYTELSDLTSLISANRGGKAAGLKVTMDASTLQDGDAVRIDGQTYQFVSKAGQADITGAKEIVLASIGDGLTNGELIDALIDNLPAGSYVDKGSNLGFSLPDGVPHSRRQVKAASRRCRGACGNLDKSPGMWSAGDGASPAGLTPLKMFADALGKVGLTLRPLVCERR